MTISLLICHLGPLDMQMVRVYALPGFEDLTSAPIFLKSTLLQYDDIQWTPTHATSEE